MIRSIPLKSGRSERNGGCSVRPAPNSSDAPDPRVTLGVDKIVQSLGAGVEFRFWEALLKKKNALNTRQYTVSTSTDELQVQDIIDFLPDPTFAIDAAGRVIVWNHAMEELSGVLSENMLGKGAFEYALPFYNARRPILIDLVSEPDSVVREYYPDFSRSGSSILAEACVHRPHVGDTYLWGIAKPLYNATGQCIGAIQSLKDVTQRRQEEEKSAAIFRLVPVVVTLSTVSEGRYVEASDYFYTLSGYTREQVIGRTSFDLNLWEDDRDRDRILALLRRDGRVINEEVNFRDKHGQIRTMYFSAEFVKIQGEDYLLSLNVDVTDRKRAEEERDKLQQQLQHAQKLESIGRLAGGVAHDFNNLLTAIIGNTQLALMELPDSPQLRPRLEAVMSAAESAASLTRQLLAFSRRQVIEPRVLGLNQLVLETSKMLKTLVGEDVRLKTRLNALDDKIVADPGQVEQIIANLAVNARDAMPKGGRLVIETSEVDLDEHYCATHPNAQPGPHVMLAVSDTGTGMTEEVKKNLFEPFFTTKPKGMGTGLGLATVYGAVKQNQASIEVYSVPEKGTSVKVYFPWASEQREASHWERRKEPVEILRGNGETILFVEDDERVSDFAIDAISGMGYRVLRASCGQDAMDHIRSQP